MQSQDHRYWKGCEQDVSEDVDCFTRLARVRISFQVVELTSVEESDRSIDILRVTFCVRLKF